MRHPDVVKITKKSCYLFECRLNWRFFYNFIPDCISGEHSVAMPYNKIRKCYACILLVCLCFCMLLHRRIPPCNEGCMMNNFYFSLFQSSSDDWLLFEPADNTWDATSGDESIALPGKHCQLFKITPVSCVHKCYKLHTLCGWELPGAQ